MNSSTRQRDALPACELAGGLVRPLLTSLFLAAITLCVFWPVLHCNLTNYDDPLYFSANPRVQSGLTHDSVVWAFRTGRAGYWQPLVWLSYMLDVTLFGTGAVGPHFTNLLLHVANAILVFLVLKRLTGAQWRSAFVAALFALHPLRVESVAWVTERKDVLSAFFGLLTLLMYARYGQKRSKVEPSSLRFAAPESRESRAQAAPALAPRPWTLDYCLALLFFTLGLMSKPMLVTLPFVMLLLDFWPLRRFDRFTVPGSRFTISRLVREKIPFFVLSAIFSVITHYLQRAVGAVTAASGWPFHVRLENAFISYTRYLGKTFWPAGLAPFYPHPGQWPMVQVVLAAALVTGLCVMALWLGRKFPFAVTGWFWFFGMLVPVIGLVQAGEQSMADRFTYVPSIGLFLVLVWGAAGAVARWRPPRICRTAAATMAGLILVACAAQTTAQLGHWHDNETLFRQALAVTKNNYVAYNNLGTDLASRGRYEEAIVDFRRALAIKPNFPDTLNNLAHTLVDWKQQYAEAIRCCEAVLRGNPNQLDAHNNLGNALVKLGRIDEAIEHYQAVLRREPDHADAHNNLGIALVKQGKLDEAIAHFQEALRLGPNDAQKHGNLGKALAARGRFDDAIRHFVEALRLAPDYAEAHQNLADVLLIQGRKNEAEVHYHAAIQSKPDLAEPRYQLAVILASQGHMAEAVFQWREAVRLSPDWVEALNNLAWVLATDSNPGIRNGAEAVQFGERAACATQYQDYKVLDTLAAAYAETGHFTEAIDTAQKALSLAERKSDVKSCTAIKSRLRLYQERQPFHESPSMLE